jgi:hypothetical protein
LSPLRIEIPNKNLGRQRYADGFNSGVKGLEDSVSRITGKLCYKPEGSIPGGVTRIFHRHNPSGCTMAVGLAQPLTGLSTRNNF